MTPFNSMENELNTGHSNKDMSLKQPDDYRDECDRFRRLEIGGDEFLQACQHFATQISHFVSNMSSENTQLRAGSVYLVGRLLDSSSGVELHPSSFQLVSVVKGFISSLQLTVDSHEANESFWGLRRSVILTSTAMKSCLSVLFIAMNDVIIKTKKKEPNYPNVVEMLKVLRGLLEHDKQAMSLLCVEWLSLVLPYLCHAVKAVRRQAFCITSAAHDLILKSREQILPVFKAQQGHVLENFELLFRSSVGSGSRKDAMKQWALLVQIMGSDLADSKTINSFISFLSNVFSGGDAALQCQAFQSWQTLIETLSLDVLCSDNVRNMIMTPLSKSGSTSEATSLKARFDCWWSLIRKLGPKIADCFTEVCSPLIRFTLCQEKTPSAPGRVSGQKCHFDALVNYGIGALILLLGQKTKEPFPFHFQLESLYNIHLSIDTIGAAAKTFLKAMKKAFHVLKDMPENKKELLQYISAAWARLIEYLKEHLNSHQNSKNSRTFIQLAIEICVDLPPHLENSSTILELVEPLSTLPCYVLASPAYNPLQQKSVHKCPALLLLEKLLMQKVAMFAAGSTRFLQCFEALVHAGCQTTYAHAALGFIEGTLACLTTISPVISASTISSLWICLARTLKASVEKHGEVNQGDSLDEGKFDCFNKTLIFPVKNIFGKNLVTEERKQLVKIWSELWSVFNERAVLVRNVRVNAHVESLCSILCYMPCLKSSSYQRECLHLVETILSNINFLQKPSPEGSPQVWPFSLAGARCHGKNDTLGNITSFVQVLKQIVAQVYNLYSSPSTKTADRVLWMNKCTECVRKLFSPIPTWAARDLVHTFSNSLAIIINSLQNKEYEDQCATQCQQMYEAVCSIITDNYVGEWNELLTHFHSVLEAALKSPRIPIRDRTVLLWRDTFAHASSLTYPSELKYVLSAVKKQADIILPGWQKSYDVINACLPAPTDTSMPLDVIHSPVKQLHRSPYKLSALSLGVTGSGSPLRPLKSPLKKLHHSSCKMDSGDKNCKVKSSVKKRSISKKSTGLGLDAAPNEEFKVINSSSKKDITRTPHQKEVLKRQRSNLASLPAFALGKPELEIDSQDSVDNLPETECSTQLSRQQETFAKEMHSEEIEIFSLCNNGNGHSSMEINRLEDCQGAEEEELATPLNDSASEKIQRCSMNPSQSQSEISSGITVLPLTDIQSTSEACVATSRHSPITLDELSDDSSVICIGEDQPVIIIEPQLEKINLCTPETSPSTSLSTPNTSFAQLSTPCSVRLTKMKIFEKNLAQEENISEKSVACSDKVSCHVTEKSYDEHAHDKDSTVYTEIVDDVDATQDLTGLSPAKKSNRNFRNFINLQSLGSNSRRSPRAKSTPDKFDASQKRRVKTIKYSCHASKVALRSIVSQFKSSVIFIDEKDANVLTSLPQMLLKQQPDSPTSTKSSTIIQSPKQTTNHIREQHSLNDLILCTPRSMTIEETQVLPKLSDDILALKSLDEEITATTAGVSGKVYVWKSNIKKKGRKLSSEGAPTSKPTSIQKDGDKPPCFKEKFLESTSQLKEVSRSDINANLQEVSSGKQQAVPESNLFKKQQKRKWKRKLSDLKDENRTDTGKSRRRKTDKAAPSGLSAEVVFIESDKTVHNIDEIVSSDDLESQFIETNDTPLCELPSHVNEVVHLETVEDGHKNIEDLTVCINDVQHNDHTVTIDGSVRTDTMDDAVHTHTVDGPVHINSGNACVQIYVVPESPPEPDINESCKEKLSKATPSTCPTMNTTELNSSSALSIKAKSSKAAEIENNSEQEKLFNSSSKQEPGQNSITSRIVQKLKLGHSRSAIMLNKSRGAIMPSSPTAAADSATPKSKRCMPSGLLSSQFISPSGSILKRPLDKTDSPPCTTPKRVKFCVPDNDSQASCKTSGESTSASQSQLVSFDGSVTEYQPTPTDLNDTDPIAEEYIHSTEPIESILQHLTSSTWVGNVKQVLVSKGCQTIGDLARLTEVQVVSLPIKAPKVSTMLQALRLTMAKFAKQDESVLDESEKEFLSHIQNIANEPNSKAKIVNLNAAYKKRHGELVNQVSAEKNLTAEQKLKQIQELFL